MKLCSRCEEEFADKFCFCPVDGTPLTPVSARVPVSANIEDSNLTVSQDNDPSVTRARGTTPEGWTEEPVTEPVYAAAGAGGSMAIIPSEEYHLTIMSDAALASRLVHEVSDEYQLTWPEFKRDPFGFTKRTFVGYGNLFLKFVPKPKVRRGADHGGGVAGRGSYGSADHRRIWRMAPARQMLIGLCLESCPETAKDSIIFCCGKAMGANSMECKTNKHRRQSSRYSLRYQQAHTVLTLRLAVTYSLLALFGINVLSVLSIIFLVGLGKIILSERLIYTLIAATVAQSATIFVIIVKFIFSK